MKILRWLVLSFFIVILPSICCFASQSKPKIAVVVKSLQNEFFLEMQKGAEDYHKKNANEFELIFRGLPNETDLENQIKIVDELLKQKIDALIIAPVDSVKIIPSVMKAIKENVLVINLDNKLDERALAKENINIPFVGPSNFNGAKNAGKALAKVLKAGDTVGIIEGLSTSVNAKARSDGFRSAMKEAHIKIYGTLSGNWEEGPAKEAALKMLTEQPQIKALLCGNDNMAIGAIQALETLNLKGKVYVVGYDNIPKAATLLKSKDLFATVDQFPSAQAISAVELAVKAVKNGQKQETIPKVVQTKTLVIMKE